MINMSHKTSKKGSLHDLYLKSFKKLLPNTRLVVKQWLLNESNKVKDISGNSDISLIVRAAKATLAPTEMFPAFQKVLVALDTISNGLKSIALEKMDSGDRMRLVVSNVPDKGATIAISKMINDLGESMSSLNLQSSYMLADGLGFVSIMNKSIIELSSYTMAEDEFLLKDNPLDQRRLKAIINGVTSKKTESIDACTNCIMRVEKALEIWNDLGAVEKWVSLLATLRRLVSDYASKWVKKGSLIAPTVADNAFNEAQSAMALIWSQLKALVPEDIKDSAAFDGINKWLKNSGDKYNYRRNGIEMVNTLIPLIDELQNKSAKKAMKCWLFKVNLL